MADGFGQHESVGKLLLRTRTFLPKLKMSDLRDEIFWSDREDFAEEERETKKLHVQILATCRNYTCTALPRKTQTQ